MKSNQSIVFFPGKGIFCLPEGMEIVSVHTAKEARAIFDTVSYRQRHHAFPAPISMEIRVKARAVIDFYEQHGIHAGILRAEQVADMPALSFSDVQHSGTRSSTNRKEIDWVHIESILRAKGYELKKREYLRGALDTTCPVFYVEHAEYGVMAEGKGLTEEQARRSALAEATERVFGAGPSDTARESIAVDSYRNLYGDKDWNLGVFTGPRDLFSEDILTEWIPARNISRDESCFLPAELAYFEYIPRTTRTRLLSLHHTMGLAAGSSLEDATLSGIFEVIERDAYWITMRCRINSPDIDLSRVENLDPSVLKIITALRERGFELSLKDMSLDWGVPVVHAVLTDSNGGIPAFSHGTGASFTWATAVARAVCEAVQMYAGLSAVVNDNLAWEEVVSVDGVLGKPTLAWSDPLFKAHISHLLEESNALWNEKVTVHTVPALLKQLREGGHEVIVADLMTGLDLRVVRVHITNATQPDPRLERISPRLEEWRLNEGLSKGFYTDPILT